MAKILDAEWNRVITLLENGWSITAALEKVDVNNSTFLRKRSEDSEFNNAVGQAIDAGLDVLADKLLTIDEEIDDPSKAKLRSDNIKWLLARRSRKKYGDKVEYEHVFKIDIADALKQARERIVSPAAQEIGIITTKQESIDIESHLDPKFDEDQSKKKDLI